MLANQSAGLGAQLKDGQAGGVVDIERCTQQVVQTLVQTVPLVGLQLAVQNLRTLNLAAVGDESVDELDV